MADSCLQSGRTWQPLRTAEPFIGVWLIAEVLRASVSSAVRQTVEAVATIAQGRISGH